MAEHLRDAQKNIEEAIGELGKNENMAGHIEGLSKINEYLNSVINYIADDWERKEPIGISSNRFVYKIASDFIEEDQERSGEGFNAFVATDFGRVYAHNYMEENPRTRNRGLKAASTKWYKTLFDCGLVERKMINQKDAHYRFGEKDVEYIKIIESIPYEELNDIAKTQSQIKLAKTRLEELGQDSSMLDVSKIVIDILEKKRS